MVETPLAETAAEDWLEEEIRAFGVSSPQGDDLVEPHARRFSIGLSTDARPLAYGGWRPYAGPWPVSVSEAPPATSSEPHGVIVRVGRSEGEPLAHGGIKPRAKSGARLRLSVSIARTKVERLLVPLFSGGVRIALGHQEAGGLGPSAIPEDPEKASLVAALSDAVGSEGRAIWEKFATRHSIDAYIHGDIGEDPWIVVVACLLSLRFEQIEHGRTFDWAQTLAEIYPWIPDTHVLLARTRLLAAGKDEAARIEAADDALNALNLARRLGAPYFAHSNAMLGECLGALRDAAPEETQRSRAGSEIVEWRKHLPHQRTAGISFSWIMSRGAGSSGGLDSRYSKILAHGYLDDRAVWLSTPS
jgi:hypothetical protein